MPSGYRALGRSRDLGRRSFVIILSVTCFSHEKNNSVITLAQCPSLQCGSYFSAELTVRSKEPAKQKVDVDSYAGDSRMFKESVSTYMRRARVVCMGITMLQLSLGGALAPSAFAQEEGGRTLTPIKHVIVIV